MIALLVINRNRAETTRLIRYSRENFAVLSEDRLEVEQLAGLSAVKRYLEKKRLMDMAYIDVTDGEGLESSRQVRRADSRTELLLLADASVSPMSYMSPAIRAASLLLRPYTEAQARGVIREFLHACLDRYGGEEKEKLLVLENREGTLHIPYSKIYYLEVREKKVYVRLRDVEYSKYETLEHMAGDLPGEFLRCHRSFVVNSAYIVRVKLSENLIYLEGDIAVPLSRSYKSAVKEFLGTRRGGGEERV